MGKKTFYYARVSSKDQNENRQIEAFKKLGADDRDIYIEKESGKDIDRPVYNVLKNSILRAGDTLVVKELDRLSRSKEDIKKELEYFKENRICFKAMDIPTTMANFPEGQEWLKDMVNNIIIEVLGSMAEQERRKIKSRQQEGICAARDKGVKFGRPRASLPSNWHEVITQWGAGEITAVRAMELTNTAKSTFYNLVKRTNDKKMGKNYNLVKRENKEPV